MGEGRKTNSNFLRRSIESFRDIVCKSGHDNILK